MVDPVSITSLSLQVVQILAPVVKALGKAYRDRKTVHQSLQELHSDLIVIYELTDNIHRLFSHTKFVQAVNEVQRESNVNLVHSLDRALRSCVKEAQNLRDILSKFGLQTSDDRFKQAYLQWRLDRRLDDIDRLKRNFQDHKSSIQLAFQVLTTCKQMQTADRDALHVAQLKAQIDALQAAIQQISQQILMRQAIPNDEEQTKLLDDMKDMQTASVNLKRRATLRLEHITSLETGLPPSEAGVPFTAPSRSNPAGFLSRLPISEHDEIEGSSSVDSTTPSQPGADTPGYQENSRQSIASSRELPGLIQFPSSDSSQIASSPSPRELTDSPAITSSSDVSISADEFERGISALMATATSQGMGKNRPYSDDFMVRIANMLAAVGKKTWSERPRLYLVLRLINQVKTLDIFILEGFKDIDFPYTNSTLPSCIQAVGSHHDFLHYQRYILSPRSADLVCGGRHHHLDKSADAFFMSIQKLGSGGFSVVDKVKSRLSLQEYARKRIDRNKTFAKDRKALNSFENEVHNLKRLSHHHLVKFVGSYTDKRYIGIIMQPVADIDLHGYLTKNEWTSEDLYTLRTFVGCLCSALNYLHQNKCRHKDLKPQNVLIKGSTVFIADFGTAFDWTESQSDITVGPPEAFTKLYVAPEVALHQPRDTSSDVWSLGCIFLEIATVLSGNSLQSKSNYFTTLETPSAAYWQNHEAIGSWIILIRHASGDTEAPILEWIESMTKIDPSARPSAADLLDKISMTRDTDARYGRSCCFEDFDSDVTSWEGSVTGEDVFETAKGVIDVTSTTVESIATPPDFIREYSPMKDPNFADQESTLPVQLSPPIAQESTFESKPSATTLTSSQKINSSPVNSTPQDDVLDQHLNERDEIKYPQATTIPDKSFSSLGSRLIPVLATQKDHGVVAEVRDAFLESHQRLESLLITARRQNPDWLSLLSILTNEPIYDRKGFNILLVASKFNNFALATDVVKKVVKQKPELVNQTDKFKNSALHYASLKGRVEMIEFLIIYGAIPHLQNALGQTALHLSAKRGRSDAIRALLPHLKPDQVNVSDHHGSTPLSILCSDTDDAKIVRELIAAGSDPNAEDRCGVTPVQRAAEKEHTEVTKVLIAHITRVSPTFVISPLPSVIARLSRFEGLEVPDCFCLVCLLTNALHDADGAVLEQYMDCLCPNHIREFAKATLSKANSINTTIRLCPCARCVSGREYNKNHLPCGIPFNYDYSPCTDKPQIVPPFTEPPTLLSASDFVNKSFPPYPGHEYYDRLIDEHIYRDETNPLQQQEVMATVLQSLSDAGFKGTKYFREDPNEALKWVMRNYHNIMHAAKTVEVLRDCGASLDTVEQDLTLLDIAAKEQDLEMMQIVFDWKGSTDWKKLALNALSRAIKYDSPLSTRMLLRAGASVSRKLYIHFSIQHKAVSWAVPMLLAHGASLDISDSVDDLALHIAVRGSELRSVTALLEFGSPLDATNKQGDTPLSIALNNREPEIISTLLTYGAALDIACGGKPCALFYAISIGNSEAVCLLLDEYNVAESIDVLDESRQGTLHYLARSPIRDPTVIDKVFGYEQPLDWRDRWGDTPLHLAVKAGNITMAMKLFKHGASVSLYNYHQATPLDLAQQNGRRDIVECLGGKFETAKEDKLVLPDRKVPKDRKLYLDRQVGKNKKKWWKLTS